MNYWMCCIVGMMDFLSFFSSSMITCVESGLLKVWKEGSTETVSQCDFGVLQCGGLYIDNLLYNNYTFTRMALC